MTVDKVFVCLFGQKFSHVAIITYFLNEEVLIIFLFLHLNIFCITYWKGLTDALLICTHN